MAVAQPTSMGSAVPLPYFPWSPDVVENLSEVERKAYLSYRSSVIESLKAK